MTLHSAIKKVVSEQGYEVLLENKRLLNILNDFNAFSDNRSLKTVVGQALELMCVSRLVRLGKKSSFWGIFAKNKFSAPEIEKLQATVSVLKNDLVSKSGIDPKMASYVVESFVYGLGWSTSEPIPPKNVKLAVNPANFSEPEIVATHEIEQNELSLKPNKEVQYVVINFSPEHADVYVDGTLIPSSDGVAVAEVSLDQHRYEVKADGYKTMNGYFYVDKHRKAQLSAFLKPLINTAKVSVTVQTKGTEVFIDGKYAGIGNFDIELPSGSHNILAKKENYKDYETTITVKAEQPYTVKIPQLWRLTGRLNVKVKPYNSLIFINGHQVGTTPYIITLPVGSAHLRVVTTKGNEYSKDVTIIADKMVDVVYSIDETT